MLAGCQTASSGSLAIVFGNNYAENERFALNNAEADASAVAAEFRDQLGYEVIDATRTETGRVDVARFIGDLSASLRDRRYDRIVFYFSGHGETLPGPEGGHTLVLDWPEGQDAHKVAISSLVELFSDRTGELVLLIDACRQAVDATAIPDEYRLNGKQFYYPSGGTEYFYLYSTSFGEVAFDGPKPQVIARDGAIEHSPFTRSLLEALSARSFTLSDMADAVTERTSQQTNRRQVPEASMNMGSKHLDPLYRPWYATP